MGLSVGGELSSVYENIEPQQWDKKDKLNGEELLENLGGYKFTEHRFDWDSYNDGMLVYDFAFSDDAVEEFTTEENKELQELPSDGIPMLAGHLGDTSAELSGSTFAQKKNGEQIDKRGAERASSLFKSMSRFNDIDFFLNPQKASTGGNSNCAVTTVANATFPKVYARGEQSYSILLQL
ncbi:hypothetical protein ACFXTH_001860 [Malus domestica]